MLGDDYNLIDILGTGTFSSVYLPRMGQLALVGEELADFVTPYIFESSPSFINGTMQPYQLQGLN
ncbi:hypothetical protein D9611_006956 [Ephemerocybe angulata]|uniref:Uncharacterized protein n=1 Tax=Ephemerocybe angulata TaxID=980116 RepID=A0A8H5AZZ7_9AGAR|nr:hypothetical protein D9611_006956 [Tulosesus angulatus]